MTALKKLDPAVDEARLPRQTCRLFFELVFLGRLLSDVVFLGRLPSRVVFLFVCAALLVEPYLLCQFNDDICLLLFEVATAGFTDTEKTVLFIKIFF